MVENAKEKKRTFLCLRKWCSNLHDQTRRTRHVDDQQAHFVNVRRKQGEQEEEEEKKPSRQRKRQNDKMMPT